MAEYERSFLPKAVLNCLDAIERLLRLARCDVDLASFQS